MGAVAVRVAATDHRPVEPSVAYRLESEGRSVVLGGDGVPCAGLDELCKGADAYVQTVIRADLVRKVPNTRFQDIVDYHSTVEDAARTAARAGVRTLVLTHYVPPIVADGWKSGARSPRSTSQAKSWSGTISRPASCERAATDVEGP